MIKGTIPRGKTPPFFPMKERLFSQTSGRFFSWIRLGKDAIPFQPPLTMNIHEFLRE